MKVVNGRVVANNACFLSWLSNSKSDGSYFIVKMIRFGHCQESHPLVVICIFLWNNAIYIFNGTICYLGKKLIGPTFMLLSWNKKIQNKFVNYFMPKMITKQGFCTYHSSCSYPRINLYFVCIGNCARVKTRNIRCNR